MYNVGFITEQANYEFMTQCVCPSLLRSGKLEGIQSKMLCADCKLFLKCFFEDLGYCMIRSVQFLSAEMVCTPCKYSLLRPFCISLEEKEFLSMLIEIGLDFQALKFINLNLIKSTHTPHVYHSKMLRARGGTGSCIHMHFELQSCLFPSLSNCFHTETKLQPPEYLEGLNADQRQVQLYPQDKLLTYQEALALG